MVSKKMYITTAARIHTLMERLGASDVDGSSVLAEDAALDFAEGLASDFAADNPRFDRAKFLAACGFAVSS